MRRLNVLVVGGLLAALVLVSIAFAKSLETKTDLRDGKGQVVGTATFKEEAGGVRVRVQVKGLPPGMHGVHIHTIGKCDAPDFTTAGAHFNPSSKKHGAHNPDGPHAGDIPNLEVGTNGKGKLDFISKAVTLAAGANSLLDADGSALVIHATVDDEKTDPTGNSGARIACGAITASAKP